MRHDMTLESVSLATFLATFLAVKMHSPSGYLPGWLARYLLDYARIENMNGQSVQPTPNLNGQSFQPTLYCPLRDSNTSISHTTATGV